MTTASDAMQTDSANTVPVVEVLSADKVFANGTRALSPINLTIQPDKRREFETVSVG